MIDQANGQAPRDSSREDIELLLPWYVNGTLKASDAIKVETYLERHPDMQVQLATLREDMDETITANETIAGPSGAAFGRLMQQIEAETPVRHRVAKAKQGVMQAIDGFLRSLSPGRLGWAAMAAAAVIMLQAGVVGTMMLNPPSSGKTFETASGGAALTGTFVLVQFKQDASIAEVSAFLSEQGAEIVGGPKPGGLFRVRISENKLSDDARQVVLTKLRRKDTLLNLVLPSQ
jgi:anti-sigma-K factor RskA